MGGVYGARLARLDTKPRDAKPFTVPKVLGWRPHADEAVVVSHRNPRVRSWYGDPPERLTDIWDEAAEALIPVIEDAVKNYHHQTDYTIWIGPNCNTFTSWVGRQVPSLGLNLATTAIG